MTFDRSLRAASNRLARQSASDPVPAGLRAEMLVRLPDELPQASVRAFSFFQSAVGICAVASVVGIGGVAWYRTLPQMAHSHITKVNPIPAVVAKFDPTLAFRHKVGVAVGSAGSWHILGKNYANQPDAKFTAPGDKAKANSRWEIWGRRTPLFYWEQQGAETFIVDRQKGTSIIPGYDTADTAASDGPSGAHQKIHHPEIVFIEPLSSAPWGWLAFDTSDTFERLFVSTTQPTIGVDKASSISNMPDPNAAATSYSLEPRAHGGGFDVIEKDVLQKSYKDKAQLTLNPVTSLPQRYTHAEAVFPSSPSGTTTYQGEVVEAGFNQPIPKSLASVNPTPDALIFEVVQNGKSEPGIARMPATIRGLSLHFEVLNTDVDGNIYYVPHWSLGGKPVSFRFLNDLIHLSATKLTFTDEAGNRYLSIGRFGSVDSGQKLALMAPTEPLAVASPAPRRLKAGLTFEFSGLLHGPMQGSNSKYSTAMALAIDLPVRSATPAGDSFRASAANDPDLRLRILEARSAYYLLGADQKNPRNGSVSGNRSGGRRNAAVVQGAIAEETILPTLTSENHDRAVYWTNAVIEEATRDGKRGIARQYASQLKSLTPQ